MPFARNGGLRLYWRADGHPDKPALVLLNSLGTDLSMWDGVVRALSARFHILRMDTRGHGASDVPGGRTTLAAIGTDVLAVMDAAGVAKAAVAGISMGGMTALQLALDAPERLTAIVVCNSSARVPTEPWDVRAAAVRANGMREMADSIILRWFPDAVRAANPPYLATALATLRGLDPDGYAACCEAIRDMALWDGLPGITVPTLVVNGALDASTPPPEHGDRIAARIPGAHTASLPTGHISALERPDALAGLIAAFLLPAEHALEDARDALFDRGLAIRRTVLGSAHVDRSLAKLGGFAGDFQRFITQIAWSEVWGRPGLDHRTRRVIVLAITLALGRWEEFRLHLRAALEQGGLTADEVKEVLIQSAIYAGVPASNTAFHHAEEILATLAAPP